ncbi:hypothetical protein Tco_0671168 [Tanacetum coccineum]
METEKDAKKLKEKLDVKLDTVTEEMIANYKSGGTRNIEHDNRRLGKEDRKVDDHFRRREELTWKNIILFKPISYLNESYFNKIATVQVTIMDTSNCCLVGNQSVTVGKVMIHTISPDLIREVVHVKVKNGTYKVVVVEEINDMIEIDVDQKTSKEEEGGGENSYVAMEHGTFQDDNGEDEDGSDDGRRQTDNDNEDVDDNEGSSSDEKKKSASKGFKDSKSQKKDMAADELSNIQMKDTAADELSRKCKGNSDASNGWSRDSIEIREGFKTRQSGDFLNHQAHDDKAHPLNNKKLSQKEERRVSEDALIESNKNHKEKEDDIISNESDSIAKD